MYNLDRFLSAQESMYSIALSELQNGKKESHWIWFIFPQLKDLGFSTTSKFYGIDGINEAYAYLEHPVLRERLEKCVQAVLNCKKKNPVEIFGSPDYLKFHSSLTLFVLAEPENVLFKSALDKFYRGAGDYETEEIISKQRR